MNLDTDKYGAAYNAAFPCGVYIPGYGPPLEYDVNPLVLRGNPDITPYLQGPARPPEANESGWKDTAIMYPGQVTRIAVRYAPLDKPVNGSSLYYPFYYPCFEMMKHAFPLMPCPVTAKPYCRATEMPPREGPRASASASLSCTGVTPVGKGWSFLPPQCWHEATALREGLAFVRRDNKPQLCTKRTSISVTFRSLVPPRCDQ